MQDGERSSHTDQRKNGKNRSDGGANLLRNTEVFGVPYVAEYQPLARHGRQHSGSGVCRLPKAEAHAATVSTVIHILIAAPSSSYRALRAFSGS
jgi:hypothetical protein